MKSSSHLMNAHAGARSFNSDIRACEKTGLSRPGLQPRTRSAPEEMFLFLSLLFYKTTVGALFGLFCLLCACGVAAQNPSYKLALPGYHYEFPRDYFNHPEFQTEWWYYTGNMTASDGRHFGFELTFFRVGLNPQSGDQTWDLHDVYLAHLALSDLDGKRFYHVERVNRAGPGIAGIDAHDQRIWNGNWRVTWRGDDQLLESVDPHFSFSLTLRPAKPPVIHGQDGVSQKADRPGHASYYFSLTRLQTRGTVQLEGQTFSVSGLAWMDHEFFTNQLAHDQVGWDWFSLQLSDNTELMLYRLRRADGSIDPYSSGTYIDATGRSVHLCWQDFSLDPENNTWRSNVTGAVYPVHWRISVPMLELALEATTPLHSQELAGHSQLIPNYWEGSIQLNGHGAKSSLTGVGYLEMTGYDRPVQLAH